MKQVYTTELGIGDKAQFKLKSEWIDCEITGINLEKKKIDYNVKIEIEPGLSTTLDHVDSTLFKYEN